MGGGASTSKPKPKDPAHLRGDSDKYEVYLGPEPTDADSAKKEVMALLERLASTSARWGPAMQADGTFVHRCGAKLTTLPAFMLTHAALPIETQLESLLERIQNRGRIGNSGVNTQSSGALPQIGILTSPTKELNPRQRGSRGAIPRLGPTPSNQAMVSPRNPSNVGGPGGRNRPRSNRPSVAGVDKRIGRPFRKLGGLGVTGEEPDDSTSSGGSVNSGGSQVSTALGDIAKRAGRSGHAVSLPPEVKGRSTGSLEDLLRSAADIAGSSLSNLRELCSQTARRAAWLLGAEKCTIWIKDPNSDRLFAHVDSSTHCTSDLKNTALDIKMKELEIPLVSAHSQDDQSVEQYVFEQGDPFKLCALTQPELPENVNIHHHERGVEFSEAVYQPIIADRQVYGICKVSAKFESDGLEFTEDDENMLAAFIIFVGVCFKNALLYKDLNAAYAQTEVLLDLTKSLSSCGLDVRRLCDMIIQAAKKLLNSDRCALFLLDWQTHELVAQFEGQTTEVRLPMGKGIAGHVAETGQTLNIRDAYSDSRFNKDMDLKTGYKTDTILCAPIRYEGEVVAVAQLVNKRTGYFTLEDEETFDNFGVFSGINIRNCMTHQQMLEEKKTIQAVLKIVQQLQEADITKIGPIMNGVMGGAKELANCDRCALFLVDKERNQLVAKVASGHGEGEEVAIRVNIGEGIAGSVAKHGETMNVRDAYSEPKFNKETDRNTGYVTKTILCMPVKYGGETIAVTQLVNKQGDVFGKSDEERLNVFTQFAGMCLRNAQLIEFMREAEAEQRRLHEAQLSAGEGTTVKKSNKFISITEEQLKRVLEMTLTAEESDTLLTPNFNIHEYNINSSKHDRLPRLLLEIFARMGLIEKYDIPKDKFIRLTMAASAAYRHVPYHNFTHAFDVVQTLTTFLKALEPWDRYLTTPDVLALLFSGIFHDIDHMGLNNSFQLKAETPLGVLSSSSGSRSVLEVHHCNLTIDLMSDPECNIFCNLEKDVSRDVWKTIIDSILATDMARHNELSGEFTKLSMHYNPQDGGQRRLLVQMLLKAGDISNITRPFEISRMWAQYVTAEFYYQGDAERHLGLDVTPMFDRQSKAELATGQIGFMKGMGMPYFTIVVQVLRQMQFVLTQLQDNLSTWEKLVEERKAAHRKVSEASVKRASNTPGPGSPNVFK
eukprot:Hpha_TRINITY_DN16364_c3_g6::TRINITY_DN16364_c3_g6_i1::g.61119::m.61119/K13298/PDE11; dual 3',5'-cyclic-AMP and -GMP phosphodiesterase 11